MKLNTLLGLYNLLGFGRLILFTIYFREYFWLYKVSYLYNGVFGLLTTLLIGYCVSFILNKIFGYSLEDYDPKLFIPPLSKWLEKRTERPISLYNGKQYSESDEDFRGKYSRNRKF